MPPYILALGTPVTFTRTLHRKRVYPETGYGRWYAKWVDEAYPGEKEPEPRDGIIVGVRTLRNGEVLSLGYDEPLTFRVKESVTAYLVAFDLRRSPVLVPLAHLRIPANSGTA